jgi:hypothetical protein
MVQVRINIEDKTNKILKEIQSEYNLKNKSQTVEFLIERYGKKLLNPELRPEYIKKLQKIQKDGKYTKFSSVKQLKEMMEKC